MFFATRLDAISIYTNSVLQTENIALAGGFICGGWNMNFYITSGETSI